MEDLTGLSNQQLMADLFVAALRVNDGHLNALAAELLVRSGRGALPRLTREACDRGNRPGHRVRLLDVISRIGPPFGEAFFDLHLLLRERSPKVREAANELLGVGAGRPGIATTATAQ
jgi:hypothetical protein